MDLNDEYDFKSHTPTTMLNFIKSHAILCLCLLGTLIRLGYGLIYTPWSLAPDHIAWELVLEQGSFQYNHLIHYPHEGGTILIALLALIVEFFSDFSSLAIVALLLDFVVRWVQIRVVKDIFGAKVALFFGIWTVFATPSILPWGMSNFGLHAISSVFPFLLLAFLHRKNDSVKFHALCGAFLGLALWFSYSNAVLIPVFFGYRILKKESMKRWLYSLGGLAVVLGLHLFVRKYADAGFQLSHFGLDSVRGEQFSLHGARFWDQLSVAPTIAANSMAALPDSNAWMEPIRLLFYFFWFVAGIGFLMAFQKRLFHPARPESYFGVAFAILPTILLFLGIYLFSPFFGKTDLGDYVVFRHLTYILPLIALFTILGLSQVKYGSVVLTVFLVFGTFRSSQLFFQEAKAPNEMTVAATGWVLGTKFGHDPQTLVSIVEANPQKRKALIRGIGWGSASSLMFEENHPFDQAKANAQVEKLVEVILSYPLVYRADLLEGVLFAFSDQVQPRLNPELYVKFEEGFRNQSKE